MIREHDRVIDYWRSCPRCGGWARIMGREIGLSFWDEPPDKPLPLERAECPCKHLMIAMPPIFERIEANV